MTGKTKPETRYGRRGVSSEKADVHAAIAHLDAGLFPGAFCKILPDIALDPTYCTICHADGAGTKASLAYLVHLLTGNVSVWKGIAWDSLAMNTNDMGCAGAVGEGIVSSTIDRNLARIPGEVVEALISGTQEFCDFLTSQGMSCLYGGGETADVGDLVRTVVVNHTVMARMRRSEVVNAGNIRPPAFIVGFSSTGRASWEHETNSGIGSNGLTNARHDTLNPCYRVRTETYAPETDQSLVYCGPYGLHAPLPGDARFTIASALLSPTRSYLPLIKRLFSEVGREHFMALIHCTGGGQTKIGKYGPLGTRYLKYDLFPVPPLFRMLGEVRNLPLREQYQAYNMGHLLEAVVGNQHVAEACIKLAGDCGIEAKIVGVVIEDRVNPDKRTVAIKVSDEDLEYSM